MKAHLTIAAFAAGAILAFNGAAAFKTLQGKAAAQLQSADAVESYKQSYLALADSQDQWEARYPLAGSGFDYVGLLELAQLKEHSLTTDRDAVGLSRIEAVKGNGHHLGLTRYCLSSDGTLGAGALRVEADTYGELLIGLQRLAAVPYIHIGSFGIQGDWERPTALLGDFCLQLREVA